MEYYYGKSVCNGMKLMFRSVVIWYKMSFMVYFELVLVLKEKFL